MKRKLRNIVIWLVSVISLLVVLSPIVYIMKVNSFDNQIPMIDKNITEVVSNNTYVSNVKITGTGGNTNNGGGTETGEFNGTGDGKEVAKIGGWLAVYDGATVNGKGREIFVYDGAVPRPGNKSAKTFHSEERMTHINPYYGGTQQVITMANGNLINEENRTWCAFGPEVTNPGILKLNKSIGASDMFYGTYIDVVLKDETTKQLVYLPTVIGECKMHTWSTGIVQTSYSCQPGHTFVPGHADASIVEFIGKADMSIFSGYSIHSLIVYDGIGD